MAAKDEEFVEYDPDQEVEDTDADATVSDDDVSDDENLDDADLDGDEDDDEEDLDEDDDDEDDEGDSAAESPLAAMSSGRRDLTQGKSGRKARAVASRQAANKSGKATTSGANRRGRMAAVAAAEQKSRQRRTAGIIALCVALAALVLAYPVYMSVNDAILRSVPRAQIGAPADQAGCLPDDIHAAAGNQEHVADGTVVQYIKLPPDSGPHYQTWASFGDTYYEMRNRPNVENLVHNLEHGYTILWYDDTTITMAERNELRALANTYKGADPSANKFIAAPWVPGEGSGSDGGTFPTGTRFIMARWVANPQNPTNAAEQRGVRRACAQLSGQAVEEFMAQYPVASSPEPNGG